VNEVERIESFEAREAGERVDRYLAGRLSDLSRTAIQRLIAEGLVTVNGGPVAASLKLRTGDKVLVRVPAPQPIGLIAEPIALDTVYEDPHMLVINKASGMVVHPGAGHGSGTLVNALLAHCDDLTGVGGDLRPGIVHRLDRDTSGLIVVAKSDRALQDLQRQFKRRSVSKIYSALVVGNLVQPEGIIEAPIARDRRERQRMAVQQSGKASRTRWSVVQRYRDSLGNRFTLLDVYLLTGRTHQIRVHLSWMGFPLVGDAVYGKASSVVPRQFLHARELAFEHPVTGIPCRFSAPLPPDLDQALHALTPCL
jgi:23S rRNA pseudouridine1911/1915/1917 synthase